MDLVVDMAGIRVWRGTGDHSQPVTVDQAWNDPSLTDVRIEVVVPFTLFNYGRSPAHIFFPSMNPDPDNMLVNTGGSRYYVIPPGGRYTDLQRYRLTGQQAVDGVPCQIVVTCDGVVHGATFDTLRWLGTLQPLRSENGRVRLNDQIPINAGPAQFVREYPALDRPEEMHELAERVRLGR
jgi:hypothetical protein